MDSSRPALQFAKGAVRPSGHKAHRDLAFGTAVVITGLSCMVKMLEWTSRRSGPFPPSSFKPLLRRITWNDQGAASVAFLSGQAPSDLAGETAWESGI